jgi:hypothetical protein
MGDVLTSHADVVSDLVDVMALLGAGQDAGAAQAVDGRIIGLFRVDVPFVFFGLVAYPFLLPEAADFFAFLGVGEPARARSPSAVYWAPFGE